MLSFSMRVAAAICRAPRWNAVAQPFILPAGTQSVDLGLSTSQTITSKPVVLTTV
jgi:hypothetical protein